MRPHLDDPTWLDAQYNNRARVADAATILARVTGSGTVAREPFALPCSASRHSRRVPRALGKLPVFIERFACF